MIKKRSYSPDTTIVKLGWRRRVFKTDAQYHLSRKHHLLSSKKICKTTLQFWSCKQAEASKNFSVKRLLTIRIIPDFPENYKNMEIIFNKLKIYQVKFIIATKLKLANIILGLSEHGTVHSCSWCEANSRKRSKGGQFQITWSHSKMFSKNI